MNLGFLIMLSSSIIHLKDDVHPRDDDWVEDEEE